MTKPQRKFVQEIERLTGRQINASITGGNHLCLRLSDGVRVFAAGTPSDFRNTNNTLRDIRRAQQQSGAKAA